MSLLLISNLASTSYLEKAKSRYEHRNVSQNELEKEIEETKELLMSDRNAQSFEAYAYLINYKILKDIYENTWQSASYFESDSNELPHKVLDDLIDIYNKNPNQCFQDKFAMLESYYKLYSKDKKITPLLSYIAHHKTKLSDYCAIIFRE